MEVSHSLSFERRLSTTFDSVWPCYLPHTPSQRIGKQCRVKGMRCVAAAARLDLTSAGCQGPLPPGLRGGESCRSHPPFVTGEKQRLLKVLELDLSNTSRNQSLDLTQSSCFSINPEVEDYRAQGKPGNWLPATTDQLAT